MFLTHMVGTLFLLFPQALVQISFYETIDTFDKNDKNDNWMWHYAAPMTTSEHSMA
ncbi:hypothetical protein LG200_06625 [Methylobacillus caricis]|uniref:hypothetical protein n=1 Tax=Methylobacillus caricis TaxID=1971611 RepID=UPI001CFFFB8E|nr:hypothetical protein [Methylobacillus caricis]MCB5187679.1 hypothetical protein [Methylobacillus caricis]